MVLASPGENRDMTGARRHPPTATATMMVPVAATRRLTARPDPVG